MKNKLYLILLLSPLFSLGQLTDSYNEMIEDSIPEFRKYEQLLFDSSEYIFKNPGDKKSDNFKSAIKVIEFWKDQDTGVNIPILGGFYNKLNQKSNQKYLYMIAMINYVLKEKIENNRILKCVKIEGQKYSEQDDVKEVKLEGAKIFLKYVNNKESGIILNSVSKKYLNAFNKGNLEKIFFPD